MSERPSDIIAMTLELSRIMRRSMSRSSQDGCSVNLIHLHALSQLKEKNNVSMKDFAECMSVSPSTATALVDRLVREGLVRRAQDSENRKRILLSLTAKGAKELEANIASRKKVLTKLFSVLSPQDVTHLRRIFGIVLQAAKD